MKKNELNIYFSAGVKYKNIYYLAASHINALFKYDEKENKLTFLLCFQKEKCKNYLYLKAFLYEDEAWFIPFQADYIAIVNLNDFSIQYLPVICKKKLKSTNYKYINILFFRKKYLCLIPQDIDAAVVYDLASKKGKAYYNIVENQEVYPYHGAIYKNKKIYFFPWTAEKILALNLETNEREFLLWNEKEEDYGDVIYDKKSGFLFHAPARANDIMVDNLEGSICKKIRFAEWNDRKYRTYYSTNTEKNIFFWGHGKDIVIKINKEKCSFQLYNITQDFPGNYFFPISSNSVEAIVVGSNCIIKYDTLKDKFRAIYISTNIDDLLREIKLAGIEFADVLDGFSKEKVIENELIGVRQFALYMSETKKAKNYRGKEKIGSRIYNSIKIDSRLVRRGGI